MASTGSGSSADVRVWVAPQLRGRGYEQRAAELAAEWLRSTVGLRELTCQLARVEPLRLRATMASSSVIAKRYFDALNSATSTLPSPAGSRAASSG